MKRFWFGAAASLFLAAPAWLPAQEEALFERLDADKDGQVAADEVDDERRRLFERLLRNGDKNRDGKLSKDEFAAALQPQPVEAAPAGGRPDGAANLPAPREIFARFDKNGDGKLSKEEAPERMRENFDRIDANQDGQIEQDELRQAFAAMGRRGPDGAPGQLNPPGRMTPEMVERLFREGDKNGDGKLSVEEVPEARREMFSRIVARMDDDGDKAITKDQFTKAFEALRAATGDRRPDSKPEGRPEGRPEGKPDGRPEGGRPQLVAGAPAFFLALDANRDGELSKEEIDNAAQALRTLDKNGDGRITRDEIGPRRPQ
ncbi:MAG: EF-hand domain-containing protein [Pirellulales bacterium]